ncbi:uncharacterized protein LOC119402274 [Rhipicephalus sanguineus]|uniref:uncharacterized protein LOC119402274 n=1 Tax=Rhipicephalus sanguineus TaxID=34632 RepID=UPI0018943323|nr:uncharacterized protein LOC119402274 [Rhipicephalus sanguineus]
MDLEQAWYTVSLGSTYTNPSIITGLSLEMSALEYVMQNTRKFLNESLFEPCVSVKRVRQPICERANPFRITWDYYGYPLYTFASISNASKVLTMGELRHTLAIKFLDARHSYGRLRARTAWLLFNVHNARQAMRCPDPPFEVIREFCHALERSSGGRCRD